MISDKIADHQSMPTLFCKLRFSGTENQILSLKHAKQEFYHWTPVYFKEGGGKKERIQRALDVISDSIPRRTF